MSDHIAGPLYAEHAGASGPRMLLVHSLPNDHSIFVYQIAHFSTRFRVTAVDLPGLGRSPRARPGLTMGHLADACWDAVPAPDPAILVGVSIGAGVVKHMAVRAPERVLALILTGAGYYERDGATASKGILARHEPGYAREGIAYRRTQLAGNFSDAFRASPLGRYFVELFAERNDTADVDSILALLRAHDAADPPELHERIVAPALVVTGELDRSRHQQELLATHIRGARQLVIPESGHLCNLERPADYDREVLAFTASLGL